MARLLLIEDDEVLSRMYKDKFVLEGFEVVCAYDGEDGWAKLQAVKPDLVLLDIMMPKLNGLDLLKKAKSDAATKSIPIVMLTNLAGSHEAQEALLSGAQSYIVKSDFKPAQIVLRIKEILVKKTP